MRFAIRPWHLVLAGIVLNISAAVITHYFIKVNNQQISQLQQDASRYDTLIDSQWRQQTELQRQREFLLLLLTASQSAHQANIQAYIEQRLRTTMKNLNLENPGQPPAKAGMISINQTTDLARDSLIGSINENYLEKLDVNSQIEPLQSRNSLLFSVSIFLQMMGLILVVAKDIFD